MTGDLTAQHRVEWLLRTLDEAREAYSSGSTGDGVRLMPSDYHEGSYRELERALIEMRIERPSQHWHVSERYRRGVTQSMEVVVIRRKHGPELRIPAHCEQVAGQAEIKSATARVRVYKWSSSVDMGKVRKGVDWLTREMYGGRKARIVLPDALYRQVVGLPPREGRRERPERVVATVAA